MNVFKEWLHLQESVIIKHVDPEEWEEAEQALAIAKMVNIRIDSSKDFTFVALNDNDDVIGAAYTNISTDHDASSSTGEEILVYSFDVVVHPKWQGYEMVGMQLIKACEQERDYIENERGAKVYTRLWVVNPRLAQILQNPRFGYELESEHGGGSAHLVKY